MKKLSTQTSNKTLKIKSKKPLFVKTIEQEANEVFKKYQKSFKDLARYDRGEKISAAN